MPYELGPGADPVNIRGTRALAEPRIRAAQVWVVPRIRPSRAQRAASSPAPAPRAAHLGARRQWVLVAWPAADQWVFVAPGRDRDPRGLECLRAVPLAVIPAGRRLVLRALIPRRRLGPCSAPAMPSPTSRSGLPRARSTRARSGRCSAPATRCSLLSLGLVAHLNERALAPAGQERRPRSRRNPAPRDLARLAVVARAPGPRRSASTCALLSDWNGEAARGFGIAFEPRGMEDVPGRACSCRGRRDGPRSLDARGRAARSRRDHRDCSLALAENARRQAAAERHLRAGVAFSTTDLRHELAHERETAPALGRSIRLAPAPAVGDADDELGLDPRLHREDRDAWVARVLDRVRRRLADRHDDVVALLLPEPCARSQGRSSRRSTASWPGSARSSSDRRRRPALDHQHARRRRPGRRPRAWP